MSYRTDSIARQVHGRDPQKLIDPTLRHNIYNTSYWLEECLGVDPLTLIDRAQSLLYIGSATGAARQPTSFACLLLKLLQIQPSLRIIIEYLQQEHNKYLRVLAAFYIRLVCSSVEIFLFLEPLYADYRKVRYIDTSSDVSIVHIDEIGEKLISETYLHGFTLPALVPRWQLEMQGQIKSRTTYLHVNGEIVRPDQIEQFNLNSIDILNPFYETAQVEKTRWDAVEKALSQGARILPDGTLVFRGQPQYNDQDAMESIDRNTFNLLFQSTDTSNATKNPLSKLERRKLDKYQVKQRRKWFGNVKHHNDDFLNDSFDRDDDDQVNIRPTTFNDNTNIQHIPSRYIFEKINSTRNTQSNQIETREENEDITNHRTNHPVLLEHIDIWVEVNSKHPHRDVTIPHSSPSIPQPLPFLVSNIPLDINNTNDNINTTMQQHPNTSETTAISLPQIQLHTDPTSSISTTPFQAAGEFTQNASELLDLDEYSDSE